jgi:hypothetical protein
MEKKADFLHSVVNQYIRDADKENRPELVNLWNTIKEDEQRHMELLKEELAKEISRDTLTQRNEFQ